MSTASYSSSIGWGACWLALILSFGLAGPADAAPVDAPWQGSGSATSGPAMTTTVTADGSAGAAVFEYDNNAPVVGGSGASGNWQFATTATAAGQIDLSYAYAGFHAFFQVRVTLEAFVFDGASTTVIPLVNDGPAICCTPPSGGFSYSGEVTLDVDAGDQYGFRLSGANGDSNSRLRGVLTVDSAGVPGTFGASTLVQAVPQGAFTLVAAHATGTPGTSQTLQLLTGVACIDGALSSPTPFAEATATFDANGEAYLTELVANTAPLNTYAAARLTGDSGAGALSECVIAGPDNDTWVRALTVPISGAGGVTIGQVTSFIDSAGKSRWYRFTIRPGAKVNIDLTGATRDYDLAVFKDIAQAFVALSGNTDVSGLNRLSAEFAPSVFSPSVFSPSVFSPSVFSPDAYAPSVFSPSVFSPSVFSPSVFSPSVFSPSVFSPSVFSPSVFSPSVFSPSVFSPSVFSPSVFSPSVFSADSFASAQTRSLIAVSAQTGTAAESVVVDTWNNTGSFYVRVSGKNGAFDASNPVSLSVRLDGDLCAGVTPRSGSVSADAGGYETIILWDRQRLAAAPGNTTAEVDALADSLNALAARPEVGGVVVDLGDYPHIQALHTQASARTSCPYAANLTATAIKGVVDAYRAVNPLAYVVLVGSDAQVPFFRYPDQGLLGPEQDYDPPLANDRQSQSALRLNYVLGQDEYGARASLSLRDGDFPVPDLAVGRLVETAPEISHLVELYLETPSGVVDTPTSTLVTGYDFLADAAAAVQAELTAGTVAARNDTLITAAEISPADPRSWTASDLRRELLDEGEDIIFLAGHFSANSTLAADYTTTALATELAASDVDLANSLVFSAGCHSGYNIVDGDIVPGVTEPLDWTQAFARKGATLVAGTGYQYGDTDFVEYSERLYARFARELRTGTGPVAVGEALVRAKQNYLATTTDLRGLHRKSVIISAVFGLPMLRIDLPGERIVGGPGGSSVNASPVSGGPGSQLGLQTATINFDFTGSLIQRTVALTNLQGGSITATYLAGPDGVVTHPAEPALPLETRNVSVAGQSLRGVGLRSASWRDRQIVPLTGAPTTELRGVHTPFTSAVNFPMRLLTANYFGALSGSGGTLLHVTPAQHRVAVVGDTQATLRQFEAMAVRLFYSNNTQTYGSNLPALSGPPTMTSVRAVIDGSDILFLVNAVGDPAAGIQGVWVTYTDGDASSGQWLSLDLVQDGTDSRLWSARLPGAASSFGRLDYFVQAVNGVGLVSVDDNYGAYYRLAGLLGEVGSDGTPNDLAASALDLFAPGTGVYGASAPLQAQLSTDGIPVSGATVLFTLGGTAQVATTDGSGYASVNLPLTATPGAYTLTASFAGDSQLAAASSAAPFAVTRAATVLTFQSGAQTVGVDGVDPGLSAQLADEHGTPLLQRTVYLTVTGAPGGPFTQPLITDNLGKVRLGQLSLPGGNYQVAARFLGTIPTASGPLVLTDPVYSAASRTFDLKLKNGAGCPVGKAKKNLLASGFCYLTGNADGKIHILNGTLIVGSGVTVKNKIDQIGPGSVRVLAQGRVGNKITETGPGDVIVFGTVDNQISEIGPGNVEVGTGGSVGNKILEALDGSVIIHGYVGNKVTETFSGDLIIGPTGHVRGSAEEFGPGVLINEGRVDGKVSQH